MLLRRRAASLKKLLKLVPPPAKRVEASGDWPGVERGIGTKLPTDYRQFIEAYGSGQFGKFYWVYNPFTSADRTNLLVRVKELCARYQKDHEENRRRFPYAAHPVKPGLLPWGHDDNGNFYFWFTEGEPDKWVVLSDESRGRGFARHEVNMSGYLLGVMEGRITPLAGDYPRKNHRVFDADEVKEQAPVEKLFAALRAKDVTRVKAILDVSNHPNPATGNHFKCRHFEKACIRCVASAAGRRREQTDGESAQDGGASGNPRFGAAEVVVSPDRRGTWRGPGDGLTTREGGGDRGGDEGCGAAARRGKCHHSDHRVGRAVGVAGQ